MGGAAAAAASEGGALGWPPWSCGAQRRVALLSVSLSWRGGRWGGVGGDDGAPAPCRPCAFGGAGCLIDAFFFWPCSPPSAALLVCGWPLPPLLVFFSAGGVGGLPFFFLAACLAPRQRSTRRSRTWPRRRRRSRPLRRRRLLATGRRGRWQRRRHFEAPRCSGSVSSAPPPSAPPPPCPPPLSGEARDLLLCLFFFCSGSFFFFVARGSCLGLPPFPLHRLRTKSRPHPTVFLRTCFLSNSEGLGLAAPCQVSGWIRERTYTVVCPTPNLTRPSLFPFRRCTPVHYPSLPAHPVLPPSLSVSIPPALLPSFASSAPRPIALLVRSFPSSSAVPLATSRYRRPPSHPALGLGAWAATPVGCLARPPPAAAAAAAPVGGDGAVECAHQAAPLPLADRPVRDRRGGDGG